MNRAPGREFDFAIVGAGVVGTVMASLLVARKLAAPGRVAVIAERPPAAGHASRNVAADRAALAADPTFVADRADLRVAEPALVADRYSPAVGDGVPPRAHVGTTGSADWGARVFALSRASQRLLEICGVWAALPHQKINPYERMCVWDARGEPGGSGSLAFDSAELGEPNLGFIVEGEALHAQCLNAATAAGVVFIDAAVDTIVIGDHVHLGLHDGRSLRAGLLLAADGTDSRTRALLDIETAGHSYHQDALVAHVRTAKSHDSTAWQRFLTGGPLAFLPLPDGRSSIVWSVARDEARRLCSLAAADFGAALTAASGGVLGACELTTPVVNFPLKLQYALHYVRTRAVLLGDAAHVVHPLAGQGLNLGFLDCASLAETLSSSGSVPGLVGERVLRRYERWRRSENLLAATALDGLERLFSSGNPMLARLRMAGLSAVGRVPLIKRQFALRALGMSGDVPAFLKSPPPSRAGTIT